MTSRLKLLAAASATTIALMGSTPVWAGGTASGTDITNSVTVNYQVGGVAQTASTATNSFKVDRKINFTVAEATPTGTTAVSPGSTQQVTVFRVTNTSNAPLDFALTAAQLAGGAAAHGGTDSFDMANLRVFADNDDSGSYVAASDTKAFITSLAPDASRLVFLVADTPSARSNGDVAGVTLTASGRELGGGTSVGAALVAATDSTVNDPTKVETVFADAGRSNSQSAGDDYTVSAALLSVTKLSRIVSDGLGAAADPTNPKALPGATVEYCIVVANAPSGATATNVAINDSLAAISSVTYDSSFGVKVDGTAVSGSSCTPGSVTGAYDTTSKLVSGTLSNIAAGQQRTLVFRVTIN